MTIQNRIAVIARLKKKSDESLRESQLLFDEAFYDSSISRAYYAMFYLAQAMLATKDIYRKRHSGVLAAFGQEFVKTGLIAKHFSTKIQEAFDERLEADYGLEMAKTGSEAKEILKYAKEYADQINLYLDRWIDENAGPD